MPATILQVITLACHRPKRIALNPDCCKAVGIATYRMADSLGASTLYAMALPLVTLTPLDQKMGSIKSRSKFSR